MPSLKNLALINLGKYDWQAYVQFRCHVVYFLLAKHTGRTIEELTRLAEVLRQAKESTASEKTIRKAVENETPVFKLIIDILPKDRKELYAFISMLLVLINLIIGIHTNKIKDISPEEVINIIYVQQNITNINTTNMYINNKKEQLLKEK